MDYINLGYTDKHTYACCVTHDDSGEDREEKIEYPCLYVYDAPKELMGIPKEGEAKIRYKVKSKTERTSTDKEGDEDNQNSIDIEIHDFKPISEDREKEFSVPEIDENEILISIERTKKKERR